MIWVYLKFIKLFIKLFKSVILRINFFEFLTYTKIYLTYIRSIHLINIYDIL